MHVTVQPVTGSVVLIGRYMVTGTCRHCVRYAVCLVCPTRTCCVTVIVPESHVTPSG